MAGIGFELKKLYSGQNESENGVKAAMYSSLVTVGPWILTTIALNILSFMSKSYIPLRSERNIFMSAIMYAFIFSQVFAGGIQYVITRYISDALYSNNLSKLKGAFTGSMKFIMILTYLVGMVSMRNSPLPVHFRYTSVILFVLLSALWVSMNFISIIKGYKFVAMSYLIGNIIALILGGVLLKYPLISAISSFPPYSILLSYTVGIGFVFLMISGYLLSSFKVKSDSEFEFIKYFKSYFSLALIGGFFALGVWGHVFVEWFFGDGYLIGETFISSPLYEVAVFYAFLITIPTLVYFAVFMETRFFPVYKKYYALLAHNGNLLDIEETRENMVEILKKEIFYCMEFQFVITFSFALLAKNIFEYFNMDLYLLDLFKIMSFAAYLTVFISIFITLTLYFDARKEALQTATVFFLTSIIFSYLSLIYGKEFRGVGFFAATVISFIVADRNFNNITENLNYSTFYRQNFKTEFKAPILGIFEKVLNKKIYLPIGMVILLLLLGGCGSVDSRGFNTRTRYHSQTMTPYDKEGYDYYGFNYDGVDRRGFDGDWNVYTDTPYDYYGFNKVGKNKKTGTEFDERGFDYKDIHGETKTQFDLEGYDHKGIHEKTKTEYNESGWTWYGLHKVTQDYYNEQGYNINGYSKEGYNREGITSDGYNREGYDKEGYDREGYNSQGYNKEGYSREGYDKNGMTVDGYNRDGYDKAGYDRKGVKAPYRAKYDKKGYNEKGYDSEGYDKEGYNKDGYDREGYDRYGYDRYGYNKKGVDKKGFDKNGIYRP